MVWLLSQVRLVQGLRLVQVVQTRASGQELGRQEQSCQEELVSHQLG